VELDAGGAPLTLHNFYVPAGGDEPDETINPKFAHKLGFLDEMTEWIKTKGVAKGRAILVGDLNIAPLEHDVWSHKALLKVVSHTPIEVEKLNKVFEAGEWIDSMRRFVPADEKLYTWWSYRARIGPPPIAVAGWIMFWSARLWAERSPASRSHARRALGASFRPCARDHRIGAVNGAKLGSQKPHSEAECLHAT